MSLQEAAKQLQAETKIAKEVSTLSVGSGPPAGPAVALPTMSVCGDPATASSCPRLRFQHEP
jgi:hypothetical protein